MLAKLTGFTSGWLGGDEFKARKSLLQRVPSGVEVAVRASGGDDARG